MHFVHASPLIALAWKRLLAVILYHYMNDLSCSFPLTFRHFGDQLKLHQQSFPCIISCFKVCKIAKEKSFSCVQRFSSLCCSDLFSMPAIMSVVLLVIILKGIVLVKGTKHIDVY